MIYTRTQTGFQTPFESEPDRSNGFISKTVQEAIEEARTSFTGKGYQITFLANGGALNAWLSHEDANVPSNATTAMMPFSCRIVCVTFTNANVDADFEIRIGISNKATANSAIARAYKWTIVNGRTGVWADSDGGFTVDQGDRIGVYIADQGGNTSDLVVHLHFIILSDSDIKYVGNHTADMAAGGFPGVIPDIFI